MARADGDALHVKDLRDVVRVNAVDVERHDARPPVSRRPIQREAVDLAEAAECIRGELVLVRLDRLEPDLGDVVERDAKAVRLRDRGRAGLELVRQLVPARAFERD